MHGLADQLAAIKENVEWLNNKCFSFVVSGVGAERGLFSIQLPVFLMFVRFLPLFYTG